MACGYPADSGEWKRTGYHQLLERQRGLAHVIPLVELAASSQANVLLRGETGTGKEIIARAIHARSSRCQAPFVVANCAAIPHDLMESEMFGHVRGAFTGAVRDHVGYFEAAGQGTLLLDEIGDLHHDLQAKILRVVEEGSFRRVGNATELRNHARLVASTNQPLEDLVVAQRFRADLYYRLNVLTIDLPRLRDRRQDVPVLARHFLSRFSHHRGAPPPAIGPEAMGRLIEHEWTGNVRELRNCMERISLIVQGDQVRAQDVEQVLSPPVRSRRAREVRPLVEVEREAIETALRRFGGNRTRAAAALGIGRRTLQNKIHQFGLEENPPPGERNPGREETQAAERAQKNEQD